MSFPGQSMATIDFDDLNFHTRSPGPTPECWKGLPKVSSSLGAVVVKSGDRV